MPRTTLDLETGMLLRVREAAKAEGRSQAALIREAIAVYLEQRERPKPKGVGVYASGRSDLSERTEELLAERSVYD
jgi:hypothetical protein